MNSNNSNFKPIKKKELAIVYTEYIYTRTKDIDEDTSPKFLCLFASLVIKKYQTLGSSTRKKVIPIHSESLDIPLSKMPSYAKTIPDGTIGIKISKQEFEKLLEEAKENPISLFTYKV